MVKNRGYIEFDNGVLIRFRLELVHSERVRFDLLRGFKVLTRAEVLGVDEAYAFHRKHDE